MTAFGRVKFVSYGKKTNQNKLATYLVQWHQRQAGMCLAQRICHGQIPIPP